MDISNALLAASEINGMLDFTSEIDFVDALSGKTLYPLYHALQGLPVLDAEFLDTVGQIVGHLQQLAPYIEDVPFDPGNLPDSCRLLAENEQLASNLITTAKNVRKVARGLKLAGTKLDAIGKSKIAGRAGVWGWAGVSYTGGALERLGKHLESLGDRLTPIVDKATMKRRFCILKTNQENIIQSVDLNHQQFIQNDQAILDALKAIPLGGSADLNQDGMVDLADYATFLQALDAGG